MQEIRIETKISVFESFDELSDSEKGYMNKAIEIRKKAYAPYSKFLVGAAIVLDNGVVLQGSNQENAAYPSGLCAERVVVFYAGANYPENKIVKMFISAAPSDREATSPIPPCGSCRQSISEYEVKQDLPIEIYYMGSIGPIHKSDSLKNLLPFMFDKANL
jgi:cytidine deaminase